jgi:hypothetical protein
MEPHASASIPDDALLARPMVVGAAAAVLALEGLLLFLVGLQNTTIVRWVPPYDNIVYVMMALGVTAAYLAYRVSRVNARVHIAAIVIAVVLALASGGWTLFSFVEGALSLLALAAAAGAMVAVALLLISLPACRRCEQARARLLREGIEYNL